MKKENYVQLILFFVYLQDAQAAGANEKFNYDESCQKALTATKNQYAKAGAIGKRVTKGLSDELAQLDSQLRIITDKKQDLDLRTRVTRTAEASRQSALRLLAELQDLDLKGAEKIDDLCRISPMRDPFRWPDLMEEMEKTLKPEK